MKKIELKEYSTMFNYQQHQSNQEQPNQQPEDKETHKSREVSGQGQEDRELTAAELQSVAAGGADKLKFKEDVAISV